jgi:hypothetical protein
MKMFAFSESIHVSHATTVYQFVIMQGQWGQSDQEDVSLTTTLVGLAISTPKVVHYYCSVVCAGDFFVKLGKISYRFCSLG